MPTIPPPKDDDGITINELYYVDDANVEFTKEQYDYIKQRLSMPPWICSACGLVNHHYNKACANFRCKVPKP